MIKMLIEHGANLNVINDKRNSALILATGKAFEKAAEVNNKTIKSCIDFVVLKLFSGTQVLIENGADVNIVGQDNETAVIQDFRQI